MLYEFKSRATGSVTMTGDVGARILGLIGKPADPKGVITVAQLPAAIAALQAAVAAEQAGAPAAPAAGTPGSAGRSGGRDPGEADDDDEDDGPAAEPVSLAQRTWPLLDLFQQALAAGKDVTWGV